MHYLQKNAFCNKKRIFLKQQTRFLLLYLSIGRYLPTDVHFILWKGFDSNSVFLELFIQYTEWKGGIMLCSLYAN